MILHSGSYYRIAENSDVRLLEQWNRRHGLCLLNIPEFPDWCNKQYRSGRALFNPREVTCSCHAFRKTTELNKSDYRKICPHLYRFYRRYLSGLFEQGILDLIAYQLRGKPESLFESVDFPGAVFYGLRSSSSWISVYIIHSKCLKYMYQVRQKRWAFSSIPENHEAIVADIQKML